MNTMEAIEQATESVRQVAEKSALNKQDTLKAISESTTERFQLLQEIEEIEEVLKRKKDRIREIEESVIPTLMDGVGIPEIKLPSGHKITVSDHIAVSIIKNLEADAFEWLEEHNYGDIIKNELSVTFDKKENEKAQELRQKLQEEGFNPSIRRNVHSSTLKA